MNGDLVRILVDRSNPGTLRDRCLVVALVIQEFFGGELLMYVGDGDTVHYANSLLDVRYDFSEDHRGTGKPQVVDSPDLLRHVPRVANQLCLLRERFSAQLIRRMPVRETQHVIIQDVTTNSGSYVNPDFSCVLL